MLVVLAASMGVGGCNQVTPEPVQSSGSTLCVSDFERCVTPVLDASINSRTGPATCSAAGCHSQASGSGGAFKIFPNPQPGSSQSLANFFAARGFANLDNPSASRLLTKPDADSVPHAGGDIFPSTADACRAAIATWISNRVDNENAASCGACQVPAISTCGY